MDHAGQGEQDSAIMSHRCEGLSAADLLSQNLNLCPSNSLSLEEDRDGAALLTGPPLNDNGHLQGAHRGSEEEEDDTDALMKEEDEESDASSLVHCPSPGTPMTDSSYSDTGSLLETAFSPGTSPEPPSFLGPEELRPLTSPAARPSEPGSLEQLAEYGDDAQLPQRLHQVAQALVLTGDYQQALCCIHLERLYHQRVLENLQALQELWEPRCRGAALSTDTKHLEALQQLCRTHSRPRLTQALRPHMDSWRPTPEEGAAAGPGPAEQRPADTKALHACEGGRGEVGDAVPPLATGGERDGSEPAQLQGGDFGQAEEMEDEAEEETLLSGTEEEIQRASDSQEEQKQPPSQPGQQLEEEEEEEEEEESDDVMRGAAKLDDLARLITVEELSPASGLVSILKRRIVREEDAKPPAARRVRFQVSDDGYESEVGGGDSCLLLLLLCLVTVVISVGGTALYCALGDPHSSVCLDFSRKLHLCLSQSQRVASQLQHWLLRRSS
ncbi:consortin-like isoform X2 [Synchiropus splendidus]|uniref:consortin-like isoform X2 n=1 Tax=Synchiropus splendidus TaxID=270530 RepID=UPI00237D5FD6|nr:consortin-like isoform X2 [Synchiropus splendidus]